MVFHLACSAELVDERAAGSPLWKWCDITQIPLASIVFRGLLEPIGRNLHLLLTRRAKLVMIVSAGVLTNVAFDNCFAHSIHLL